MCQRKDSIVIEVISFNAHEMTQQPINRTKIGIFSSNGMPQKIGTCKLPEFRVVAVVDVVHPHAMYTIALLTFVYVQNVGITVHMYVMQNILLINLEQCQLLL